MEPLKQIGLLLKEENQPYPRQTLQAILGSSGATLHLLHQTPKPGPLDLVIAMGGDGTVLRALDEYPGIPVLAINYGTVGFLTSGDQTELEKILNRVLAGDYLISERLILKVEWKDGSAHAVNEAAVKAAVRMARVDVMVNGARIRTIRGDGVIVGTPTGSTGYLLSAGSPVVMPDCDCFVLDGLNEYNFSSRSLILPPTATIQLKLLEEERPQVVRLIVDGKPVAQLEPGDQVSLRRSERTARLIFLEPGYFFHNLSSRLSWK